jgi:hypothetical protein
VSQTHNTVPNSSCIDNDGYNTGSVSCIISEVARSPPEIATWAVWFILRWGRGHEVSPHKPQILQVQYRPGSSFRCSLGNASPDSSPQTPGDHVRVGSLNLQHGVDALQYIRPSRILATFGTAIYTASAAGLDSRNSIAKRCCLTLNIHNLFTSSDFLNVSPVRRQGRQNQ